jgi:hypothetical protein
MLLGPATVSGPSASVAERPSSAAPAARVRYGPRCAEAAGDCCSAWFGRWGNSAGRRAADNPEPPVTTRCQLRAADRWPPERPPADHLPRSPNHPNHVRGMAGLCAPGPND